MDSETQNITTLHELLDYDARKFSVTEMQLKNVLPRWINKASALKLKNVLQRYLDFVQKNAEKFEAFIAEEKLSSLSFVNKVMSTLIEETESKLDSCQDPEVKDACLLASVQSINHYKISMYGTAAAFARILGKEKAANLFHEAEVGEKQIDDRLTQLAEHEINDLAKTPIVLPG
jgi:ferritin-like metal-binding protein YciE